MIKKNIENLDLTVYSEKLDNGLEIYVVPMENVNNIYTTFSTKFGSTTDTFIPLGEKEMVTVPLGVAHFLEHKLFEQEDGTDPFTFFNERGADANANTSYFKTTYLFKGPDYFDENLIYLLDYVSSPYFTDENVAKEKGIIEQEYSMYQDEPGFRLYEGILKNLYKENAIKDSIVGTKESINAITKEDLYRCYNTFYHPSNMFIAVTGNVDAQSTIDLIKNYYKDKKYKKEEIVVKEVIEPIEVSKDKEVINMDVLIPKIAVGYKINTKNINIPKFELRRYLNMLGLKFDKTSIFSEKIVENNFVTEGVEFEIIHTEDTSSIIIYADTKKPDELIKLIKEEILNTDITEEDIERSKKITISNLIFSSDNINSINNNIMNNIINYNEILYDIVPRIRKLNMADFKKLISEISFENVTEYIILPKNNLI